MPSRLFTSYQDFLAQTDHFAWGAMLTLIFALWGHWWIGAVVVLIIAAAKEIREAAIHMQSWLSALRDFLFSAAGVGVAVAMILIRRVT